MANYLPVLLISVSTNAVPDDSSLSTLPRAQVDYLSHDWQEEDVWRSWRNMTRQKNEITNGMRLENASWRTWWKQRNKLKTISPETLNWLKDSDVTWLYGPLHTAVDWTPPPKPQPVPDSIDGPDSPSAHDRLDLFSPNPTLNPRPCKPILKHRSISELLISNLNPTSPVFSPVESEDEDDTHNSTSPTAPSTSFFSFEAGTKSKRPILIHTKSDTHITRWGSRAFRKDSPPRIDPPGFDASTTQNERQTHENMPHLGPMSESTSQGSNSSGGAGRSSSSGAERTKKKHISFNTYVQQYIAIEKPKKSTSGFFGASQERNWYTGNTAYPVDDGYEEDSEGSGEDIEQVYRRDTPVMRSYADVPVEDDDDGIIEIRSSSHRNYTKTKPLYRSQSKVSTTSESSSSSASTVSTVFTTNNSISTDTTSPAGSLSPCRTNRRPSPSSSSTATARRSSSSTYRPSNTYTTRRGQPPPPFMRTPSEQVHFTIAPIAPTILKTTGVWSEGFGDEEGNDDEFGSWDTKGLWPGQDTYAGNGKKGKGKTAGLYGSFGMVGESDKEGQSSDGTPVELVYVPPFESNYSLGMGDEEYKEPEEYRDVLGKKARVYQTGVTRNVGLTDSNETSVPSPSPPTTLSSSGPISSRGSSRTGDRQWSSMEEEYGCYGFGGPDLGEDYYYARRNDQECNGVFPSPSSSTAALGGGGGSGGGLSTSGSERQRERERERRTIIQGGEERQSRSRSRSQSRTPSPAFISSPVSTAPAPTVSNGQVSRGRKRSSSASATPSATAGPLTNDLLSPPAQRGRALTQPQSQSQLLSPPQSRGRSSTRTASSSSSWDREGSSSVGSSPMGSLGFDGLVRAGGREREKEKESESERGRERRGREWTSEKMLAGSEIETAASSGARAGSGSSTRTTRDAGEANNRIVPDSKFSSTTSSCSSSTSTVMGPPPSDAIGVDIRPINKEQEHRANFLQPQEVTYMRCTEEEQRRRVPPTPSSSPAMGVRMSAPPEARNGAFEDHAAVDQRDSSTASGITSPNMAELAPSPTKLRPPPLILPPPLLAKPSTSFTAVSSSSPVSPIINTITTTTSNKASPTTANSGEHTIVGKAVDIVSSAGAFLGLWQLSSKSEG